MNPTQQEHVITASANKTIKVLFLMLDFPTSSEAFVQHINSSAGKLPDFWVVSVEETSLVDAKNRMLIFETAVLDCVYVLTFLISLPKSVFVDWPNPSEGLKFMFRLSG